jgi:hypothetical protein
MEVLNFLNNLPSYSNEIPRDYKRSLTKVQLKGTQKSEIDYYQCEMLIEDGLVRVPKGTKVRVVVQPSELSEVYQYYFNYNFWGLFFR